MTVDSSPALRDAYLSLLKRSLLGQTIGKETLYRPVPRGASPVRDRIFRARRHDGHPVLAEPFEVDLSVNKEGTLSVWSLPPWTLTMIGDARLDNVESCMRSVLDAGVPGDFIETGVWKGGTTIFMRGVLRAHGATDRKVFVADSFEGLPTPDLERYPADEGMALHFWPGLAVSLEEVRANFERFDLLDDQVEFVKGRFRDTLPGLRDHTWAVLRLDGDYYEATMDALENLYPGLSPGGWVIVDDYDISACAKAVTDYRERNGIEESIVHIDWTGICWQKGR